MASDTSHHNFLGLPPPYTDYKSAKYAVLPIPYDATVSFMTGTRYGPQAIISASRQLEEYDEEYGLLAYECGIATLDAVAPHVAGPAEMHERIYRAAKKVLRDGKFLIGLGGEHSVSTGLIRAAVEKHKRISVLQIDAHADLRDTYEGSPHSHACAMRRALEYGVSLVAVGIRAFSQDEHRFMKQQKFSPITPRQVRSDPDWILKAVDGLSEKVYVTIDIDGFDPAYAPGTGTPEPGGLDWFEVSDLLKATAIQRQIVGADVVEVIPQPGGAHTEFLAARVIHKLIAHIEGNRKKKR